MGRDHQTARYPKKEPCYSGRLGDNGSNDQEEESQPDVYDRSNRVLTPVEATMFVDRQEPVGVPERKSFTMSYNHCHLIAIRA